MIHLRVFGTIDLRGEDGHEIRSILAQPKRFFLLVYICLATPRGFHRRDKLIALFWPELDSSRARNALSQALHVLRRGLQGVLVNRDDDEVGLVEGEIAFDVVAFEMACLERRWTEGLELYRGDLLEGFFVADAAPELDRWLEDERARLRRMAVEAALSLAVEGERQGNLPLALHAAQRAVALAPYDEAALRCKLTILQRQGNGTGALLVFDEFQRRLRQDLDIEPSLEIEEFVRTIRASDGALSHPIDARSPALAGTPRGAMEIEPPAPLPPPSRRRFASVSWAHVAAVALALLLVSVGVPAFLNRDRGGGGSAAPGVPVEPSVAVLPFVNMSAEDDQEHFSDGITEALIDALGQVEGLKVPARTSSFSFKGKNVPVDSIGRALRVAHLVEGSVRKSGNRLLITARLINARDGYGLWSQSYDRELENGLEIQNEIAREIAQTLRVELAGTAVASGGSATADPRAYELYLRGLYQLNRRNPALAIPYLEQAIARDSSFARAYAALAQAYRAAPGFDNNASVAEYMGNSRRAVDRALRLDPSLPEARSALGFLLYTHEWDYAAGEREVRRAIELNPNSARAYYDLAQILEHGGRTEEAIVNIRRAMELDPMQPQTACVYSFILLHARRYREALQQFQAVLNEHDFFCGEAAIESYYMLAEYGDAAAAARALYERQRDPEEAAVLTSMADSVLGAKLSGERPRSEWVRAVDESSVRMEPFQLAKWYIQAGDHKAALGVLESLAAERHPSVIWLTFPYFDPLHSEPRYRALLTQMGMPLPPDR